MEIITQKNGCEVQGIEKFNLELTLDCGQAFRWEKTERGTFKGIAYGKETEIEETENGYFFYNTAKEEIENIWNGYFGFSQMHAQTIERIRGDFHIDEAYRNYGELRILNQEPWEALCSFIISACNNIPRIKGIVKRLCENFGEKTLSGYTFPSAKVLAEKTENDLQILKAGYRVPYILDAAKKVSSGEIDLEKLMNEDEQTARKELMKIKGVGRKVADCTLLFSMKFEDVYPVDRHIDRATKEFYPDGLPHFFSPNKGLAQQYIFLYQLDRK